MAESKRRGRPPLEPENAKRASFNTRLRPAVKLALGAAAKKEGRSLSEEIEFRLERSLEEERQLTDALEHVFGRQVAGLTLAIGCVTKEALPGRRRGSWLSDRKTFRLAVKSINLWLQAIDPASHPTVLSGLRRALDDTSYKSSYPEMAAGIVARGLAETDEEMEFDFGPWVSTIQRCLGSEVIARLRARFIEPPSSSR
jgi:hypothetical protein